MKLGYGIAFVTLLYFIVYALACPTPQLVAAVAIEVIVFIAVLGFRSRKKAKLGREVQQAVLDELSTKTAVTEKSWSAIKTTSNVVALSVLAFLIFDFTCLTLTCAKHLKPARELYLLNPVYKIPGIHPALSAELLAGAYIEANRLDDAERLSDFLLDIRKQIYGQHHPMIAEMFGNYAFISLKRAELFLNNGDDRGALRMSKKAEAYARLSIKLWKETSGYHHLGNALTKLGNALTMQNSFDEAIEAYQEALRMREREFGISSERVLKTLTDLEVCLRKSGRQTEADAASARIKRIEEWQQAHLGADNPWIVPIAIAVSFALSFLLLGPKGLLTTLALKRIEARVQKDGANADPKDVQKLISLYKHRKDEAKIESYETLLKADGSKTNTSV